MTIELSLYQKKIRKPALSISPIISPKIRLRFALEWLCSKTAGRTAPEFILDVCCSDYIKCVVYAFGGYLWIAMMDFGATCIIRKYFH